MTAQGQNRDWAADACARVRPLLGAFHDEVVNALQHARVTRHVARCTACAEELAQLGAVREALRAPVLAELSQDPTADMWAHVAAELDRQDTVRLRSREMAGRVAGRLWAKYARPSLAVATAAAVAVAALVVQPQDVQQVNVARDTFTIEEIDTPDAGVLVYESDVTGMTIIWVIEDEAAAPDIGDQVAL